MKCIGMSKIGLVRKRNEDRFCIEGPFCIVTDGMGGYKGGEIASTLAIDSIAEALRKLDTPSEEALQHAVSEANRMVYERVFTEPELKGMGTTAVVAYEECHTLYWANVGDSRLYLFDDDGLVQISTDHSMVQSLYEAGTLSSDEMLTHPQRNILTRAVGVGANVEVDCGHLSVESGNRILLCSDGLTGYIPQDTIEAIFNEQSDDERLLEDLMALVYDAGAKDNVTIVVGTIE